MNNRISLTIFFCFTFLFSLQGGVSLYAGPLYKKVAKRSFQGVTFPFRLLAKPMDYFFRNKKKKLEARGEVFGPKLDALHRLRESSLFTLALGDCREAWPELSADSDYWVEVVDDPNEVIDDPSWVNFPSNSNWKFGLGPKFNPKKPWIFSEKEEYLSLKTPVDSAKFKAVVGRFPSMPWTKKEQEEFLDGIVKEHNKSRHPTRKGGRKFILVKKEKKIHLFKMHKDAFTNDILKKHFREETFEILGERNISKKEYWHN